MGNAGFEPKAFGSELVRFLLSHSADFLILFFAAL